MNDLAAKRPRARRLKKPIGPFETDCTEFDRGQRTILIERLTAHGIYYRLRGQTALRFVGHGAAFLRALSADTGFDTAPRQGPIRRGS